MKMSRRIPKDFRSSLVAYRREQDGSLTIFALFMFVTIVLMAGTAVDVMRQEHARVNAQNAIDSAVLAASSATQGLDRELVLKDYIEKAGIDPDTVLFETSASGEQFAAAGTRIYSENLFLNMVGIDYLNSPVGARASEQVTSVEISLVLDFTSSMYGARVAALRGAVDDFIDAVFQLDCSTGVCVGPEDPALVTVNVVPYGGTVNPGPEMAAMMGLDRWHAYGSCGVMPGASYEDQQLPYGLAQQLPHFYIWHRAEPRGGDQEFGWCPQNSNSILYAETDPQKIKDYVDGLSLNDGTGTNIGMKWGMALLDASSRDEINNLVDSGTVTGNTTGNFPANPTPEVLKVVVLMTDGGITSQMRPRDFEFQWLYDETTGLLREDTDTTFAAERDQVFEDYGSLDENGDVRPRADIEEVVDAGDRTWSRNNPYISRDAGIEQLEEQCDLAFPTKPNGDAAVDVYSVRLLESSQWTEDYMKPCAKTAGHYFDVKQLGDLSGAFTSIGAHIRNKLLSLTN